ncbi:sporulation protein YqfD [Mycoplasmatota bacterium WC44]
MNKNFVRMRTSTFKIYSSDLNVVDVRTDKEYVHFRCGDETLKRMNNYSIPYKLVKSYYNENILKRNIGLLIGVLLFTLISTLNVNSIKEIVFTSKTTDDEIIIEHLDNYIIDVLGVSVLKTDVITLSRSLRSEFIDYEWISVEKNGRQLIVNLNDSPLDDLMISDSSIKGSLVANKNGIIKLLDVRKGKPMFEYNQHVNYGDILVSGILSEEVFVRSEGYIIAETLTRETHYIDKETINSKRTGKIIEKYDLDFFDIEKERKINFELYDKITKDIFIIPGIVKVKKVQYMEKDDIITVFNTESAISYVTSKIYDESLENKVHEFESVKEIIILSVDENDTQYIITTLVLKYENIAKFKGDLNG